MWAVGYVVVPTLFGMLESSSLAGDIAGRLFSYVGGIGLVCGLTILIMSSWLPRQVSWLRSRHTWVVLGMLLITVIGEYVLAPQMSALRSAASGDWISGSSLHQRFVQLHGVSSVLFVVNSLLGLLLVLLPSSPSTTRE